jgi:tetratricopeptide (TPR) repeat protein/transcriptional regulator with XRE-family HTH domain
MSGRFLAADAIRRWRAVLPQLSFAALLRKLRADAGLTQEELAEASQLSYRTISDLERGVNLTPRKQTMRLLADTLGLAGAQRQAFEAAARERARPARPVAQATAGSAVPRQLPAPIAGFTGRAVELQALNSMVQKAAETGTVVISAVGGMAGIGKTALAVYWAHQVVDQFPDGQLYVNLRGFDPTGQPTPVAEAVRGFLEAFEVPREQIPVTLDAQAALYRSLLADWRVLVVLDNARDADQVRPLLPGSPGCVAVVTSRNQLTGLIAAEAGHPIMLELPSFADARALLTRRIGETRVADEPEAVAEIITSCARLPLALSIVAARAVAHPGFSLEALAGELRISRGSLDAFNGSDQAANVRAVFSWSYDRLGTSAQRLFRLLALHPGPDITPPTMASLAACTKAQARQTLAELASAHLVNEHLPGRFTIHDLLRAYATEQANREDPEADRQAATRRLLDHYLHTARNAATSLYPRWRPASLLPPKPGVAPEQCDGYASAWTWFEAEHPALLAVIKQAADTKQGAHAWQLSWALMDYLDRRGRWDDLTAIQEIALDAARNHGDRPGEAHAHEALGISHRWLGRYREACIHLWQALALFSELGDKVGQADTHSGLIWAHQYQGHHKAALRHARQAYALYRAVGHRPGEANALSDLAWSYALLGQDEHALDPGQKALTYFQRSGDRRGEAHALDNLGYAYNHLGHHQDAISCYRRALTLFREIGDRYHQAAVLDHLGNAQQAAGDSSAARDAWQHALNILGQIPIHNLGTDYYPDASKISVKLLQLDDPAQTHP